LRHKLYLLLVVVMLTALPVAAQDTEVVGGDDAALRDFISRTLGTSPFPGDIITIYVGEIPDEIPVDFPILEDARIVGMIERPAPTPSQIILETELAPADAMNAIVEDLGADWEEQTNMPVGPSGFIAYENVTKQFCYNGDEAAVSVVAQQLESGLTEINLHIFTATDPYMCSEAAGEMYGMVPYNLLPQLKTPEGAELVPQFGGGGGGGGAPGYRSASNSAMLETERPVAEIAADYNAQLEAAGWVLAKSEAGENFAYSGWTLTDEQEADWSGFMTITADPSNVNQLLAVITIQEIPEE